MNLSQLALNTTIAYFRSSLDIAEYFSEFHASCFKICKPVSTGVNAMNA